MITLRLKAYKNVLESYSVTIPGDHTQRSVYFTAKYDLEPTTPREIDKLITQKTLISGNSTKLDFQLLPSETLDLNGWLYCGISSIDPLDETDILEPAQGKLKILGSIRTPYDGESEEARLSHFLSVENCTENDSLIIKTVNSVKVLKNETQDELKARLGLPVPPPFEKGYIEFNAQLDCSSDTGGEFTITVMQDEFSAVETRDPLYPVPVMIHDGDGVYRFIFSSRKLTKSKVFFHIQPGEELMASVSDLAVYNMLQNSQAEYGDYAWITKYALMFCDRANLYAMVNPLDLKFYVHIRYYD